MYRRFTEPEWLARQEARDWDRDDEAQAGHSPIEDHTAHVPGKVCELCHRVIEAGQDVRVRPDGNWIHEACPLQ